MHAENAIFFEPDPFLRHHVRFYADINLNPKYFLENPTVNYPTVYPALNVIYTPKLMDYRVGRRVFHQFRSFVGGITRMGSRILNPIESGVFTVFFFPLGMPHIFNTSLVSMAHRFMPLSVVDPEGEKDFTEQMLAATSPEERSAVMNRYLVMKLASSTWKDDILDSIVQRIDELSGNVRIALLSKELEIPERTMRRKFRDSTGVSLKEFIDIYRVNQASVMLTGKERADVQEVVHLMGYYDHSHLIKHLKKYIGFHGSQFQEQLGTYLGQYSLIEKENS